MNMTIDQWESHAARLGEVTICEQSELRGNWGQSARNRIKMRTAMETVVKNR